MLWFGYKQASQMLSTGRQGHMIFSSSARPRQLILSDVSDGHAVRPYKLSEPFLFVILSGLRSKIRVSE